MHAITNYLDRCDARHTFNRNHLIGAIALTVTSVALGALVGYLKQPATGVLASGTTLGATALLLTGSYTCRRTRGNRAQTGPENLVAALQNSGSITEDTELLDRVAKRVKRMTNAEMRIMLAKAGESQDRSKLKVMGVIGYIAAQHHSLQELCKS